MKNYLLLLLLLSSFSHLQAQEELDIFEQQTDNGVDLYASNAGPIPLSVEVDFNRLRNLKCDVSVPHTVVIPVGNEPVRLLGLTVIDRTKSPEYDFKFNYIPGDIYAQHQDDFVYWLPYESGKSYTLHQGYHGDYSHKNVYALDFSMPVGTNVYAARGGIVTDIKENSNTGCANSSCMGKSNYLVVAHDDGTFSNYVHLDFRGVVVAVGETVSQGQLIAKSGNTGWSSGPHLHFEVYARGIKKNRSIPTLFRTKEEMASRLSEGNNYESQH